MVPRDPRPARHRGPGRDLLGQTLPRAPPARARRAPGGASSSRRCRCPATSRPRRRRTSPSPTRRASRRSGRSCRRRPFRIGAARRDHSRFRTEPIGTTVEPVKIYPRSARGSTQVRRYRCARRVRRDDLARGRPCGGPASSRDGYDRENPVPPARRRAGQVSQSGEGGSPKSLVGPLSEDRTRGISPRWISPAVRAPPGSMRRGSTPARPPRN